jgi:hypothetical protein
MVSNLQSRFAFWIFNTSAWTTLAGQGYLYDAHGGMEQLTFLHKLLPARPVTVSSQLPTRSSWMPG